MDKQTDVFDKLVNVELQFAAIKYDVGVTSSVVPSQLSSISFPKISDAFGFCNALSSLPQSVPKLLEV